MIRPIWALNYKKKIVRPQAQQRFSKSWKKFFFDFPKSRSVDIIGLWYFKIKSGPLIIPNTEQVRKEDICSQL